MPSTAISTMVGWGKNRGKKENRTAYFDSQRENILKDLKSLGVVKLAAKWKIGQATLSGVINRWRMEGYDVPQVRKYNKKPKTYTYGNDDIGCEHATQFLGRQSHCATYKIDVDGIRQLDMENSCPFLECKYVEIADEI
jgi:hypothetical protein